MALRSAKPEIAIPQYKRIFEQTIQTEKLSFAGATCLSMAASDFVLRDKEQPIDEKLSMLDTAIQKLGGLNPVPSYASSMIKSLTSIKVRLLISNDRHEAAKALLDQSLAVATKAIEDEKKTSIIGYLMSSAEYMALLNNRFPDEANAVFSKANEVAEAYIRREDIRVLEFSPYFSFKSAAISAFTKTDIERSQSLLDELDQSAKALEERLDEDDAKKLATYTRNIGSLKARIETALKHKQLIGNLAPEIDGEHFVATPSVTMNDLRGKVVLIDFWAVWCGPCIATFPHLIEWHEKYSDKGLVILGATHRYNYRWDKEANKATRATNGDKVSIEDELAMLEKFREQHKLHHGFFVTPEGSKYNAEFGVYGIPQAVLIDKEGKVQMIRTGSGSTNAHDLEEKIQELLKL
jgi:thiol-disulfide isomerase/thioredoxin